jgi:molecular chaperone DnaK
MTMTYWLGIDLGTTYTAAALCRPTVDELETHVVPLGSRSAAVPSVLFLAEDGSLVVGEGAQRRALTDPDRVVREFKRRIGDEIPLLVGGVSRHAHELAAVLVHWVWQRVTEREGELPEGVALTCPASWGPYKISLFEQAVQATRIGEMTRLGSAKLLSEPQAAAISYASRERVEVGAHLAVYDLGGGTFDAAVVRKDSPTAFTVLGRPEGIDGLGGVTFDEMLFDHVCAAAGVLLTQIDPNDPDIVPEVARLRRESTEAKEALSVDTDTTIAVSLGGVRQRVRVTRAEFEEMIRPELERTIEALHGALGSADVSDDQVDAILLVGGSSRIPLVSQLISAEFGQAPAIDTDPKTAVAEGAGRFLALAAPSAVAAEEPVFQLPAVPPERPQVPSMLYECEVVGDNVAEPPVWHGSRKVLLSVVTLAVLLVAGAVTTLGTPTLTDRFTHAGGTQAATSKGTSTPGPSRSAGLTGAKPGRTPAPRAAYASGTQAPSASSSAKSGGGKTASKNSTTSKPSPTPDSTPTYPRARASSMPPVFTSPSSDPPTSTSPSPSPTTTSPAASAPPVTANS